MLKMEQWKALLCFGKLIWFTRQIDMNSVLRVSLVIYQNIIPISLYISVQIVKTASVSRITSQHKSLTLLTGLFYSYRP